MDNGSLANRVERLSSLLADFKEKLQKFYDGPLGGREFCIVCKTARLRGDITGLTCGSVKCLSELQDVLVFERELEDDIVKECDSDLTNIYETLDIDESPPKIQDAICEIKDALNRIKKELELIMKIIFPENEPKGSVISFLEKIKEEVERVNSALNKGV